MSTGLKNSSIETFRKRFHGLATLRLCELSDDGQELSLIRTLVAGFYVGTNLDVTEGAVPYLVTIDRPYSPDLTDAEIIRIGYFELVDGSDVKRFRLDAENTPIVGDTRHVFGAHPAFGDRKALS